MTKNDLKDGMVVELRNGEKRLVLNGRISGFKTYLNISSYEDNLKNKEYEKFDIIGVYTTRVWWLNDIFNYLTPIWERDESKIGLGDILNQIEKLQKSADKLKSEIEGE